MTERAAKSRRDQFFAACKSGSVSAVRRAFHPSLDQALELGLAHASDSGHFAVLKALQETCNVDLSSKGGLALSMASKNGDNQIASFLLEASVNPNFESGKALSYAAYHGHEKTLELLLSHGGNPAFLTETTYIACAARNLAKILPILDRHRGLDRRTWEQAFFPAARDHHPEVLKYLLEKGVQPDIESYYAMRRSVTQDWPDQTKLLIQHAATVEFSVTAPPRDDPRKTPKPLEIDHYPVREAQKRNSAANLSLLAQAGADVRFEEDFLLRQAAKVGQKDIITCLLKCGADPNAKEGEALSLAVTGDHLEAASALLKAGGNPTVCRSGQDNMSVKMESLFKRHLRK
jgi:ankyrin repeat protein